MFLTEMPLHAPGGNNFPIQLSVLRENLTYNTNIIAVSQNIYKIESKGEIIYWYGDITATNVGLIANATVEPYFCKIELISKNPALPKGSAPYAGDLLLVINNDIKGDHLVLSGGDIFSDDAIRLWHGLVKRGNTVSVYDTTGQKYLLSPVKTADELNTYIGDESKRRYIFVLSESKPAQGGVITTFAIFEIKRLSKWPIFEHLDKYGNEKT
jgi:hypothetical protein